MIAPLGAAAGAIAMIVGLAITIPR